MSDRFPAIRITMLPKDTNASGTIFGGVILSYIDLAGGIEARRQSPKKFVTKAMHEVVFVAPVHLGDLVTFYTGPGGWDETRSRLAWRSGQGGSDWAGQRRLVEVRKRGSS